MKRFLSILLAVVLLIGLMPVATTAVAATQYATVVGGWLRLRAAASFTAETINSYYTGTQVEILSTTGSWYRVKAPDGLTGYMYGDYLTVGSTPIVTGETNATVVSANGYGVRLRKGPGTGYRAIRTFPVGTRARIIDSGSYWSYISISGYTGYMMSQFLSRDGSDPDPVYTGDATIWSSNGYGVRLRTGPGKGYAKIGVYSVGTRVKLITKGAVWDYIQVGSRRGYMMNEFLIYNNNYEVTAVSINNLKPVVDDLLSVKSISPAGATVKYSWLVKDSSGTEVEKGINASYRVQTSDVGCTIRLKVTGVDQYKGSATSEATAKVSDEINITSLSLSTLYPVLGTKLVSTIEPDGAKADYVWYLDGKQVSTAKNYTVGTSAKLIGSVVKLEIIGKNGYTGRFSVETEPIEAKRTLKVVPSSITLKPSDTYKFAVAGAATEKPTVTWSLSGNKASDTSIDANGNLLISTSETATTLTVTATVGTETATATVTVEDPSPKLTLQGNGGTGSINFGSASTGYDASSVFTLNRIYANCPKSECVITSVSLTGDGKDQFSLSGTVGDITAPAGKTTDTGWTILPKNGATEGTYQANVSVTYHVKGETTDRTSVLAVSFTVTKPSTDVTVTETVLSVTAPATNATVAEQDIITSQYTGRLRWLNANVGEKFAADTVYTAEITLNALVGYTFAGVKQNAFTISGVSGATCQNAAGSGVITVTFPATQPIPPAAPVITTPDTLNGVAGVAFSTTLQATSTTAVTWSVSPSDAGKLSAIGLALNNGVISGTPVVGSCTVAVTATNSVGATSKDITITITNTKPVISDASFANGTVGEAYPTVTLSATGGGAMTWAIASGALPAGMSLDSGAGTVSGTPTEIGTFSFTVIVTNDAGTSDPKSFSVTVDAKTLTGLAISGATGLGDVLTAVVEPSGATCSYEWFDHSTGDSYTINQNDLGKTLSVVATGTGDYTGSTQSASITVPKLTATVSINTSTATVGDVLTAGVSGSVAITGTVSYQWYLSGAPVETGDAYTTTAAGEVVVKAVISGDPCYKDAEIESAKTMVIDAPTP